MRKILLSVLYFLTGFLYIFLEDHSSPAVESVLKASIIPWLIIIFIISINPFRNRINALMFAGLIFSWAGDILLQFSFMFGLLLFLMAHISYLSAFFITPGRSVIFTSHIWILLPLILYGTGLCYFLYSGLGQMRIPVMLYALVILTMLAGAINRLRKVTRTSYWLVLAGAALFVLSDSAIAIKKFMSDFSNSGFVIMSTYITAQYFIMIGFIKQVKN